MPHVAYLGLGSNLGDRHRSIRQALDALAMHTGVDVRLVSSLVETQPVSPIPQGAYINAAAEIATTLEPLELLNACLDIERSLGRDRCGAARWGPRTIDMDVLLFDHLVVELPGLTIPHPRLHERGFVLDPLAEIAPEYVHPRLRSTIGEIRDQFHADRSAAAALKP